MECESTNKKMVATLQSRRDALETKLREKTSELKKLCIQEAELTGILPPETPIEPGESPPLFRRKVGTAFTYPENLISKLKSKEEQAVAKLELECKIQTSIAEAALGLANDGNASKSIRRKHRLEYQRSQRRLAELEMRLNVLKQSIRGSNQLKQRKKPRPPLNVDADCPEGSEPPSDEVDSHFKHAHADEPSSLSAINRDVIRNSHFYNSFGKSAHNYPPHPGYPNKCNWNRNQLYRRSVERTHHNSGCYDDNNHANWLEDSSMWRNTAPVGYFSNQCYTTLPNDNNRMKSRYGSLDRRYRNSQHGTEFDARYSSPSHASPTPSYNQRSSPVVYNTETTSRRGTQNCAPSPSSSAIVNAVLLPNQTYPENSLMRTQSLGNVENPRKSLDTHSLQEKVHEAFQSSTLGRKVREKEWRETSLDSECYERPSHTPPLHPRASKATESPVPQRPFVRRSAHTPPPLPPPHNSVPASPPPPPVTSKSPMKSPTLIESAVPFESPKNHTVVEVGKWQPYREVTKPFEMSDFYKYSTKFRKNSTPDNGKTVLHEVHNLGRGTAYPKTQNTFVENTGVNYCRSNEDINKNNLMNDACYYDSSFMNNITQRRHRPVTVVNDCNENNSNSCKPWTNE